MLHQIFLWDVQYIQQLLWVSPTHCKYTPTCSIAASSRLSVALLSTLQGVIAAIVVNDFKWQ